MADRIKMIAMVPRDLIDGSVRQQSCKLRDRMGTIEIENLQTRSRHGQIFPRRRHLHIADIADRYRGHIGGGAVGREVTCTVRAVHRNLRRTLCLKLETFIARKCDCHMIAVSAAANHGQ